jgi:hypothetical protein
MKIEDFGPYDRCLQEVSGAELTKLSENQRNEEMFMNFLRYVEMLGPSEPRKAKGELLRDRALELPKYQAYKNASLLIFDHESMIQDEEGGFDEPAKKMLVYNKAPG